MDFEDALKDILRKEDLLLDLLRVVRSFSLPDWYIAAGAVRNTVWDVLHGYESRTSLNDVDVIYFDKSNLSPEKDLQTYKNLSKMRPKVNWEVFNQARARENVTSSQTSVAYWIETPTCTGVRLETDNSLSICAPHGLEDLMNLIVRPVPPPYTNEKAYRERLAQKEWHKTWPKLQIKTIP